MDKNKALCNNFVNEWVRCFYFGQRNDHFYFFFSYFNFKIIRFASLHYLNRKSFYQSRFFFYNFYFAIFFFSSNSKLFDHSSLTSLNAYSHYKLILIIKVFNCLRF